MYELFGVISSLLYGKSLISTQGIGSFKLFLEKFQGNIKVIEHPSIIIIIIYKLYQRINQALRIR